MRKKESGGISLTNKLTRRTKPAALRKIRGFGSGVEDENADKSKVQSTEERTVNRWLWEKDLKNTQMFKETNGSWASHLTLYLSFPWLKQVKSVLSYCFSYSCSVPCPYNVIIVNVLKLTDILLAEAQIADKAGLWTLKRTKPYAQKTFPSKGYKIQLEGSANTPYFIQHTCILSESILASQLNVPVFAGGYISDPKIVLMGNHITKCGKTNGKWKLGHPWYLLGDEKKGQDEFAAGADARIKKMISLWMYQLLRKVWYYHYIQITASLSNLKMLLKVTEYFSRICTSVGSTTDSILLSPKPFSAQRIEIACPLEKLTNYLHVTSRDVVFMKNIYVKLFLTLLANAHTELSVLKPKATVGNESVNRGSDDGQGQSVKLKLYFDELIKQEECFAIMLTKMIRKKNQNKTIQQKELCLNVNDG
ncbi:hypothetical protein E5288_WYG010586 [Bos mutus]|uniref:Uncharacterized protein n=1 Tax=Bos mutus TaxID=72004 RepID=A0A6B0S190_9CETA|nr:hypothetical protein [Bos mutus]